MGLVPSTAKPLKGLKNSSAPLSEIKSSLEFHSQGIALLVSPHLLRERGLGQIDLARISKTKRGWLLEIGEVKSSEVGLEEMEKFQLKRLYSTQNFLSALFGFSSKLIRLIS
ncbi:MAG: hypothetical protein AB7I27_01185 [Bacteriovoracaceae bacterium]